MSLRLKHAWHLTFCCCLISTFSLAQNGKTAFDREALRLAKKFSAPLIDTEELGRHAKPVLLLDTRKKAEYEISHLAGAIWVGYASFDLAKTIALLKKVGSVPEKESSVPIVVYCSMGYRSGDIAERLIKAGFPARNLMGGIFQWFNEKRPVVNASGQELRKIHGFDANWAQWIEGGEVVW